MLIRLKPPAKDFRMKGSVYVAGEIYDVPPQLGRYLVGNGYFAEVQEKELEPPPPPSPRVPKRIVDVPEPEKPNEPGPPAEPVEDEPAEAPKSRAKAPATRSTRKKPS